MANRVKNRRSSLLEDDVFAHSEKRSSRPRPKRDSANLVHGIVMRARGHHFDVRTDLNDQHRARLCEIRGRLRAEKNVDTLVAVGDRVWVLPDGDERGLIERIDERTTQLSRQQPGSKMDAEDVIIANPDQALIVFAAADPEPHPRMLDRFLVVAEANGLPATICINKTDLVEAGSTQEQFAHYERIGYHVIYASTKSGEGIEALRQLLLDKVTVVAGPSGVGKSSLINAVYPDLNLRVGDVSEFLHKGKHTTRSPQLFALPYGEESYIADTPGIRELGLFDIDPSNLPFYFVEMKPLLHDCHFPSCTHDHEPDCAIRRAVESGKISRSRYESYLKLLHGEDD